ncbi:hypothetical protein [Massilia sp. S19_KUP03_FR1]|uniref:hypothetical protein n=1 Tax=Massilia sp. S19_KUP03_FR1 TaxID=3025503 RepID=UPI002FCD7CD7
MCLATPVTVCAEPVVPDAARAGVASAVQRYANAIACSGVKVMPADVMMLSAGYEGAFAARYAVLWVGDMRCFGGSGTEQTQLAIATFNTGQYVVQPELSSPVVAFESPVRVVTRIISHNARNLVLEGREYGPEDPQSTPSVPVRFILRLDGTGNWKLVDKVFLHRAAE